MQRPDPRTFRLPRAFKSMMGPLVPPRVKPIKFNNVIRDGMQANLGTNPSANEILSMMTHVLEANYDSVQLGGGTFMDLFIAKGRDEWGENSALFGEFKDMIESSALIRGAFLTGYSMNPQDIVDEFILQLAERGLNEVTNFHGQNDVRVQESVFKAVKKARDAGHKIRAPKVVCVEDNPNITVDGCIDALRAQDGIADSGVYLKNASGKIDPDFVSELVKAVAKEFPREEITFHTHNNHGLGYATATAAVEAAVAVKADLAIDTLPHPLAEGTAQISARRMKFIIDSHPDARVRARSPDYNEEGERPDFDAMYSMRHRYQKSETRYDKEIFDELYKAGMAGGATSTIKGIKGMLENLIDIYKSDPEKKVEELTATERAIAEKKAMIALAQTESHLKALYGYPTSVTPYQKMLTEAAAWELVERRNPQYTPFSKQRPAVVNYLTGGLGKVPLSADPNQIEMAFKKKEVMDFIPFVPADEREPLMETTRRRLIEAGYENPTNTDVLTAAITYAKDGFDHVMIRSGQSNLPKHFEDVERVTGIGGAKKSRAERTYTESVRITPKPQQPPAWPDYLTPSAANDGKIRESDIGIAIGAANWEFVAQAMLEVTKIQDDFYKTEMGNASFYKRELSQRGSLRSAFRRNSAKTRSSLKQADMNAVYERFDADAKADIDAFMTAIPTMLKEAGLDRRTTSSILMGNYVDNILQKVADTKGVSADHVPKIADYDMIKHLKAAFDSDADASPPAHQVEEPKALAKA